MKVDAVMLKCHGPAIMPDEESCLKSSGAAGWLKLGYHEIPNTGDGASYNGIRNWRCPPCFAEHRIRVSKKNTKTK